MPEVRMTTLMTEIELGVMYPGLGHLIIDQYQDLDHIRDLPDILEADQELILDQDRILDPGLGLLNLRKVVINVHTKEAS